MASKHTSGPWIVQRWPDGELTGAQHASFTPIASIHALPAEHTSEESANARLLGMAPELLQALIDIRDGARKHGASIIYHIDGIVDGLLAKVEG